jgi:hypothetical protein
MIFNGATWEDLEQLRDQCTSIANALEVVFRYEPSSVPNIAAILGHKGDWKQRISLISAVQSS